MEKFRSLGLSEELIKALEDKGFETPTPIQEQAIPLLLKGMKDIVGQAQTGTGKTAAFGIPIIQQAVENSRNVQALILTPTRELTIQVADELNSLKGKKKLSIAPVYGGQAIKLQLDRLKRGVDIVVGTPGRVIDHLNRRTLDISKVNFVVLDEADEMLNMGFVEDVERILDKSAEEKRMLLFSATMPGRIMQLAKKYMKEFEVISVKKEQLTTPLTDQIYFEVRGSEKFDALCRIIDVEKEFYGLIFCRTKVETDEIARKLDERGYGAEAIHGDISQHIREKVLKKFRDRKIHILTATDVAARGIDISDLTHVINFGLPQDPESYVHRIGRTGRAGKEGTAITFITPSEFKRLAFIKRTAKADIRKGTLPGREEVIQAKIGQLKEEIKETLADKKLKNYKVMAKTLLEEYEAEDTVAALLSHIYNFEVNIEEPAPRGRDREINVEEAGRTRLFVSRGKKDGLTKKTLIKFIKDESGLPPSKIGGVEVFDNFSFVNVPFRDAEVILTRLNEKAQKPIFEKAKDKGSPKKEVKKRKKRTRDR